MTIALIVGGVVLVGGAGYLYRKHLKSVAVKAALEAKVVEQDIAKKL